MTQMSFVTTWMRLEYIMLSEINKAQEDKYDIAYVKLKNLIS